MRHNLHTGYLLAYQGALGYSYIECEGTEDELKKCSFGNAMPGPCTYVGVVTQCYESTCIFHGYKYALMHVYLHHAEPQVYNRDSHLEVSEGESAEVCIKLSGPLMKSVHIAVETSDNALAIGRSNTIAFCGNGSISSSLLIHCPLQQTMTTFQCPIH